MGALVEGLVGHLVAGAFYFLEGAFFDVGEVADRVAGGDGREGGHAQDAAAAGGGDGYVILPVLSALISRGFGVPLGLGESRC